MNDITQRDLLRVALAAMLSLFGLFLAGRIVAGIATAILTLLVGLLLAVALSGPVENLGVVMMENTTRSYDHESIVDAIAKISWS